MKRSLMIAVVVLLFVAPLLVAQEKKKEWVYVCSDTYFEHYISLSRVLRRSDGNVVFWEKRMVRQDRDRNKAMAYIYTHKVARQAYRNYAYTMINQEFDCASRRSRIIESIDYDSHGVVIASTAGEDDWDAIAPESIAEEFSRGLCR